MRDMRRIQRRLEFSLHRRQLMAIAVGGALLLGLMFSAGMLVGRGMEHDSTARLTAMPAQHDDVELAEMGSSLDKLDKMPGRKTRSAKRSEPRKSNPGPDQKKPRKRKSFRVDTSDAVSGDVPDEVVARGHYTVQLGAYQDPVEARARLDSLKDAGLSPRLVTATIPDKGTWYRLRIGDFPSELEANMYKTKLARLGIETWVVRVE